MAVRLRFLIVLVVAVGVVSQWNLLISRWEWLVNAIRRHGTNPLEGATSSDTEYFCPMDPGVISEWPTRCSVCNMALVRRRKGAAVQLPDGVVARMQFSPYRVQLAGIRTSVLSYRPLAREIVVQGMVQSADTKDSESPAGRAEQPAIVEFEISHRDFPFIATGQAAELKSNLSPGHARWEGVVTALLDEYLDARRSPVAQVTVAAAVGLRPGMHVLARLRKPISEIEPFRSQPSDPPPISAGDPRRVYLCPEHPQVVELRAGRCPLDKNELEERPLNDQQRAGWWCPMHPLVTADKPGDECDECGGMELQLRIVNFRPRGEVLAVPETALIDTGERKLAYVESMPGTFDGVEVEVGPRCGDYYPVVRGLDAGQRVATAGAFLIDAETRLDSNLATSYFGAGRGSNSATTDAGTPTRGGESVGKSNGETDAIRRALAKLSPADRALAERQKVCPVTGLPLGSMGPPPRVVVKGKTVFICCEGCAARLENASAE
jgi:hypothetical protein